MNMWKKTLILSFCAMMLTTYGYFIEAEREDGIYRSGETIRFKITGRDKDEKLFYVINYDRCILENSFIINQKIN